MVTPALNGGRSIESRREGIPMRCTRHSHSARRAAAAASAAFLLLATACGGTGPADRSAGRKTGGSPHGAALTSGASCPGTTAHVRHINLFACSTCHPQGATYGFDVPYTFAGGTTSAGGTLVPHTATTPATCTVACHFPKGAPSKTVEWNAPGPLACIECHAASALPAAHPPVSADATRADCEGCHVTDGHMDGAVALVGHDPEWMGTADPSNQGFHASSANAGIAACQSCHGQDLTGGAASVSCASCHDQDLPQGIASWKVNCVMCHGGTDGASGAPPVATWGNTGDAVRVGAHTAHVAGSAIAPAADCAVCHTKPADALAGGHLDGGTAEVTFRGVAIAGGAAPAPWDRTAATCTNVYCHGATLGGGSLTIPTWTRVGQGEGACGTCHGLPPPSPHPTAEGGLTRCASCHAETMEAAGTVIPPAAGGKHLDGFVQATGGHPAAWMDTANAGFHAHSANQGLGACQGCHGADLDGVGGSTSVGCTECHGAAWKTSCVMCHGGMDNATGAPPQATWGHETDVLRVGAHTAHVTASALAAAFDCVECHSRPADALSAGHIDGSAVSVVWGPLARSGGANPTWSASARSCASTYCHGGYSGTYTYFFYDGYNSMNYAGANATAQWGDGPVTCTSCHGSPPSTGGWHVYHGGGMSCDLCHPDANATGTAVTNPALHVNGTIDVAPRWTSTCIKCH
jgi:predicted CxxxxCH...CXXCH cytochrome family protein